MVQKMEYKCKECGEIVIDTKKSIPEGYFDNLICNSCAKIKMKEMDKETKELIKKCDKACKEFEELIIR